MDGSLQKAKPDRSPRIRTFTLLNFPKGTLFNRVNFRYTTAAFTIPWLVETGLRMYHVPGLFYVMFGCIVWDRVAGYLPKSLV